MIVITETDTSCSFLIGSGPTPLLASFVLVYQALKGPWPHHTVIWSSFKTAFLPFTVILLSHSGCIGISLFRYSPLHWLSSLFFVLLSSPPHFTLSIRGLCLCTALGIKSDSLLDWMRVATACWIWEAIHSAGTLQFNLKQDWCWQTSHPLSSKMFPRSDTSIADGQRVMLMAGLLRGNNTVEENEVAWKPQFKSLNSSHYISVSYLLIRDYSLIMWIQGITATLW